MQDWSIQCSIRGCPKRGIASPAHLAGTSKVTLFEMPSGWTVKFVDAWYRFLCPEHSSFFRRIIERIRNV